MKLEYNTYNAFYNEDDRAQRLIDVFNFLPGQVNVSYINSIDHIVAWHKHNIQTDYWTCIKGSLKIGLATEKDGCEFIYLSDKDSKVLEIKPGTYHGYKAIESGSILMYYVTEKYNPEDEIRVKIGHFGEIWKAENK
jgi:dTDP-4-dehydrorhamnose 3,5-epimerase-like enzyme